MTLSQVSFLFSRHFDRRMEVKRRIVCLWLIFDFAVAILSPQMLDLSVDICGLHYNCSHPNPSTEEMERHIPLTSCPRCYCNTYNTYDLLYPGQEELRTRSNNNNIIIMLYLQKVTQLVTNYSSLRPSLQQTTHCIVSKDMHDI